MEFLESLRRLEEDVENYDDFEQLPVHTALEKRFRNTLYMGKAAEGISLPVADVAVDLFQNTAEKNLGTFTRRHVAKFNRNGLINPSSSMLGMMYARRLKREKSAYLQKVTSTELFLVSMMLATKFLYDEGEDEETFSDEWAESGNMDVKKVNEMEREFLDAIDWDLNVKPDDFYEFLQQMETWIALNEGQRRGWFSYSDMNVLMEQRDWYKTTAQLFEQSMKALGFCLAVYSLCSAALCWSMLVMQHHSAIPGMSLNPANHSHVFHGVRPLKATLGASHQSEILLPPLDVPLPAADHQDDHLHGQPAQADRLSPCPVCRQECSRSHPSANPRHGSVDCDSSHDHPLLHHRPEPCQQCHAQHDKDLWLSMQLASAHQALISFYNALLLAYHDASSSSAATRLPNDGSHGYVKGRQKPINRSASPTQLTSVPNQSHPAVGCALTARLQGRPEPKNLRTIPNPSSTGQCSVCDRVPKRSLRETVHMMLPAYLIDNAVTSATGTIPLIVA